MKHPFGIALEEIKQDLFFLPVEIVIEPFAEDPLLNEQMSNPSRPSSRSECRSGAVGPFDEPQQDLLSIQIRSLQVVTPISKEDEGNLGILRKIFIDIPHCSILGIEPCDVVVASRFSTDITEGIDKGELTHDILEVKAHKKDKAQP